MLPRRAFIGGVCCLLHAGPALAEVDPGFGTGGLIGGGAAPSCWTEQMMSKPRCRIDAALKAKIALEALREQATE